MKLFYKRPLCLILCILLGGFYFFSAVSASALAVFAGIIIGLLVLSFVFRNILSGRRMLVRICLCVALASLLLALLWVNAFFPSEYYNETVSVEGNIIAADHTDASESVITVKTDIIDGKKDRHTILVTGDKDELSGLNVGDDITVTLTLNDISGSDGSARSTYYIARGYSAISFDPTDAAVLSHGNYTLRYYFDSLREAVANRFRTISNKETGDFLAALLTGERDAIDGETELNFIRTGTSHILALSGAHLVILAYAVTFILKIFRLNNKVRTVIISIFVVLYMLLTGMSACVMRAGVMLLVTSAIYLLAHRSDGVTSLAISVTIIAICQPYAVYDISLWLSAFATLGLIYLSTLTGKRTDEGGIFKRLLRLFINGTLASVFAISASIIFCVFNFDSFSTLAVVGTLVLSPLTELLIYLGMLGLALGSVIPIGVPLILLTDLTKKLAAIMAEPSFALISFDLLPVRILAVLLAVVFLGFVAFGDPSKSKPAILTVSALFLALNLVGIIHSTVLRYDDAIVYSANDTSNLVAVRSDGELGIVASGAGKYTAYYAPSLADELRATTLDYYILPSYTHYSIEHIRSTISSIKTDTVYIPRPETSGELVLAEQISLLLSKYGTDLRFYSEDEAIRIGEVEYYLVTHAQLDSDSLRNAFMLKDGESYLTYLCADNLDSMNAKVTAAIDSAERVIIGGCKGAEYRTITLSPNAASEIYLGASFSLSDEMLEYITRKGVSVEYTNTPLYID